MQSKNLIYKNGHFYEANSNNRIGIRENAKVCIVALESDFIEALPAGKKKQKIKSAKELEAEIKLDKKITSFHKVFDKGTVLFFSIKRELGGKKINHEFEVELLEDLYFFYKDSWKKPEERLYDCTCVVRRNISNTLEFFEEVYAKSLNELHKATFVHYFANAGNPACNAIDRFYEKAGKEDLNLSRYRKTIL